MILGFSTNPSYYPYFKPKSLTSTVETGYIDVTIYPQFYKHIGIEWSIPSKWGNCLFDVYRSESEYGPFEKITKVPTSSKFLKDTSTQFFSKFLNGWYVVETRLPSGQRIQSKAITWQNKRNSWVEIRATEIQRREALLLSKFTGVQTYLFRRRNFGIRCTRCWNTDIEKATEDHCPTCLGTSFEGGYFPGYETLVQFDPTPNSLAFGQQGRVEQNVITAWTISYPQIEVGDVVLRVPDMKLYRVDAIQTTELQTVPVRQILQLNELDKESIEYRLALQAIPTEVK